MPPAGGALPCTCQKPFLEKKKVASDHRVCLDGSTPPFRASPKTPNVGFWTSKNFWEFFDCIFCIYLPIERAAIVSVGPYPLRTVHEFFPTVVHARYA